MTWFVTVLAVVLLVLVALGSVYFVGMRRKSPAVLSAVRRMNRAVINPRQMKKAGAPGAYAAVIRHSGRTSGRAYETPVGAATQDGFVIALPYDTQSDWVKNVLAAGSATIVHDGRTVDVVNPELIPLDEGNGYFPESDQRAHQLFHVEHCLRLHTAAPV